MIGDIETKSRGTAIMRKQREENTELDRQANRGGAGNTASRKRNEEPLDEAHTHTYTEIQRGVRKAGKELESIAPIRHGQQEAIADCKAPTSDTNSHSSTRKPS